MGAITFDDANFESEVLRSELPVLVDFCTPWFRPCAAVGRIVDTIADEYAGKLKVVKVDVEDAPQRAFDYGIVSIPDLSIPMSILVKGGEVKSQLAGGCSKQQLVDAVKPYLS